jgi:hypothetical protein
MLVSFILVFFTRLVSFVEVNYFIVHLFFNHKMRDLVDRSFMEVDYFVEHFQLAFVAFAYS